MAEHIRTEESRVALVTGGANGIGAAVAEALCAAGIHVVVADRDNEAAQAQAARLPDARALSLDVVDAAQVHSAVGGLERLDIVVNSAGIALLDEAKSLSAETFRATLEVNLTGAFLVAQAAYPLLAQRGGRIVTLASQAAHVGLDQHAAYCASKAGVLGLTRALALEWGRDGITVNTVSPTVVLTELGRAAWDNPAGEAHREQIPTGRFAEPHEIAASVLYLCSPEAAMVNGADLRVDGGFTAV
ncbi:GolD/DthD family dehydrogenase [Demetria terragena]|uniref:GolD/DthD family dehydrogenase n=1 Tax=Demetria terragena TaxID=63959 RepID=UPI00036109AF|nr:D-threitol dehydrogenase [Demetria terragena]